MRYLKFLLAPLIMVLIGVHQSAAQTCNCIDLENNSACDVELNLVCSIMPPDPTCYDIAGNGGSLSICATSTVCNSFDGILFDFQCPGGSCGSCSGGLTHNIQCGQTKTFTCGGSTITVTFDCSKSPCEIEFQ